MCQRQLNRYKRTRDCVILDMEIPDQNAYNTLEGVKKTPGLENLANHYFHRKKFITG